MVPVLLGRSYTETVEVVGLEEELAINPGDVGRQMVCRKGVKAYVIVERGAMFKFPDDGRKRYFNALDGLPCKLCPRKGVIRVPHLSGSMSVTNHSQSNA